MSTQAPDVPLTEKDLIFSPATKSIGAVARQLEKPSAQNLISSRLRSIAQDAQYVREAASAVKVPVFANERCGSWYVPPELKRGSAYFKSTDGHRDQWSFSLRRLNFQILEACGQFNGCMIVDSTRRGKLMPDALSKTVPIWCCVMNSLLFPERTDAHQVVLHPALVSKAEGTEIERKIDEFVSSANALQLDIAHLRLLTRRPLLPRWIATDLPEGSENNYSEDKDQQLNKDFSLVYLCSASRTSKDHSDIGQESYVQGAGDDSESWACGLVPTVFWENVGQILDTASAELREYIASLMQQKQRAKLDSNPIAIPEYSHLYIGQISAASRTEASNKRFFIMCSPHPPPQTMGVQDKNVLHLKCREGKLGSRDLRSQLELLPPFLKYVGRTDDVVVQCPTGKDLAVGVALTIICLCGNEGGVLELKNEPRMADKTSIKKNLAVIMSAMPWANPSRTTLTAVNGFLMKAPT